MAVNAPKTLTLNALIYIHNQSVFVHFFLEYVNTTSLCHTPTTYCPDKPPGPHLQHSCTYKIDDLMFYVF